MDIRQYTRLIVKRGDKYLVGKILYGNEYRWSKSEYDAWSTRDREEAEVVARRLGGDLLLFNPVAGQLKEL